MELGKIKYIYWLRVSRYVAIFAYTLSTVTHPYTYSLSLGRVALKSSIGNFSKQTAPSEVCILG